MQGSVFRGQGSGFTIGFKGGLRRLGFRGCLGCRNFRAWELKFRIQHV